MDCFQFNQSFISKYFHIIQTSGGSTIKLLDLGNTEIMMSTTWQTA